jgi:hypothetical protein
MRLTGFSRGGVAVVALLAMFLTMVGAAWAETAQKMCIPEGPSKPITTTNTKGECPAKSTLKYRLVELGKEGKEGPRGPEGKQGPEGKPGPEGKSPFTAEEQATLKAVLPYIKFAPSGVGGKPTIQFSGANVQILSGAGKTDAAVNGAGNLIIGYDEEPGPQTGSHNLLLGLFKQAYTQYGSIVGGQENTSAGIGSVVFGLNNYAAGLLSVVTGGRENFASNSWAAVSGGAANTASGTNSSVSGGAHNEAHSEASSVSGGQFGLASNLWSAVSGGYKNTASGASSSVSGGYKNTASGGSSSVAGGAGNVASTEFSHFP